MTSTITLIIIVLLAIPAIALNHCTNTVSSSRWAADYKNLIYTSVASIYQTTPSSVCPTIDPSTVPLSDPSDYLNIEGPLGYMGPLSPEGPLGMLGPIGNNTWNPSTWMFTTADWSDWSEKMTALGGPLSADGPLGPNGPVSPSQYYGQNYIGNSLFESNDFAVQLRAFGLWSALGPIGPLGALGPLGPLGPIGAHGYSDDSDGNYLSQGQVVRTVSVPYDDGTQHTFELFENYQEDFAKTMTNQDTSFMVEGTSLELLEIDYYPMTSAVDQIVTIVLVPVYTLTAYSLGIYDQQGKLIGTAETTGYIETMQLTVPAGMSLKVAVKLVETTILIPAVYRLYVTGSTEYLNQYNIRGDQVLRWYDDSLGTGDFDATLSDSESDSDSS